MGSSIIPADGYIHESCFECNRAFVAGERIFVHKTPAQSHPFHYLVGDGSFTHRGRAQKHLFHLTCVKKQISLWLPKCPFCCGSISTTGIFDWKDRGIVILKWVKQGAKIGGTVGAILSGSFRGTMNSAIFGGFTGGSLAVAILIFDFTCNKLLRA